jgi:sec-independent protein translocase protein TatA
MAPWFSASMEFPLGFIEGIGGSEVMLIMFIVLLLFGPDKLPGLAKGIGKSVREFKKAANSVEQQFKEALEEEEEAGKPPVPRGPVAQPSLPKHNLPPYVPPTPGSRSVLPSGESMPMAPSTPLGPAAQPPPASPPAPTPTQPTTPPPAPESQVGK